MGRKWKIGTKVSWQDTKASVGPRGDTISRHYGVVIPCKNIPDSCAAVEEISMPCSSCGQMIHGKKYIMGDNRLKIESQLPTWLEAAVLNSKLLTKKLKRDKDGVATTF